MPSCRTRALAETFSRGLRPTFTKQKRGTKEKAPTTPELTAMCPFRPWKNKLAVSQDITTRLCTFAELLTRESTPPCSQTTGRCWKSQPLPGSTDWVQTACQNRAALQHSSQAFHRSKRKPEGNGCSIDSVSSPSDDACKPQLASQKTRPSSQSTPSLL